MALAFSAGSAEIVVGTPAEIVVANAQAKPGDTLMMRDGVWQDADILFSANGSAAQPITLRAQTLGRVLLSGQSRLRLSGSFLVIDGLVFTNGYRTSGDIISFQENSSRLASNCRLTNCAVVDYNPPDASVDTKWVSLYGLSNRVEYCYFRGKTNLGATVVVWVDSAPNAPNYHVIARNYFGYRPALAGNGGESIRVGTSDVSLNVSRTLVEENFFEHCDGDAEFVSNKSRENTYRRNTFFECEGALTLRHGNGCVVAGNYFFGNHKPLTGGVRVVGEDHQVYNNYFQDLAGTSSRAPLSLMQGLVNSPLNGYFQVFRATVAFNTFVNCTNAMIVGLTGTLTGSTNITTLPPVDCVIANNIVVQGAGKIVDQRITPVNLLWEGNLLFGGTLGITTNTGTSRLDPQLAPAADGLWRPGPSSPALGTGQGTYSFVTDDIDGDLRPGLKDVGCDQVSMAPPRYTAVSVANTGPLWMRLPGSLLNWPMPAAITYGMPLTSTQLNATANAAGTFAYAPPAGTILDAGTSRILTVVFTPNDSVAFNVATQQVTIDVQQATLALTWTNPLPISYGTPLGPTQLSAIANVPGTYSYIPAPGTQLAVGQHQPLLVVFTPDDARNYLSATSVVYLDVTGTSPEVTWTNPAAIERGTALGPVQLNATAEVPGTFIYAPPAGTVLPAGRSLLGVTFSPDDTNNYIAVTRTVSLDVTLGGKLAPVVTWPPPAPILAGTPLGSAQLNAIADIPGRLLYSPPAGTMLSTGRGQVLSVAFVPDDPATYAMVTNSVTLDVVASASNAIVRIAYLVPSNRVAQPYAVATLQKVVLLYQEWFASQMDQNGFGRKTFSYESGPDGMTPQINVVPLPETDVFLRDDIYGDRILEAARQAGLPVGNPGQIWWLIPETHIELPDGSLHGEFEFGSYQAAASAGWDTGWAVSSSERLALYQSIYQTNALFYDGLVVPEIGPYPLAQDTSFFWFEGMSLSALSSSALGAGLRSLGEALGLDPDYRNDENFNGNLMGFGFRGLRGVLYPRLYPFNSCGLSYASALQLTVNPFFNPDEIPSDSSPPAVTISTTGTRTPSYGLLEIEFNASDDLDLHAAVLEWETDTGPITVDEMSLAGRTAHGVFAIPYFDSEQSNFYTVTVFDRHGNRRSANTAIYAAGSVNHAPQPFITANPVVVGVGEDVVLDASRTFDPEHTVNLLELEWDLDGDGYFDTFPANELVLTNNYYTPGTRLIRARITDPAGATAVSAPVAVTVTVCPVTLSPLSRSHGYGGSTGTVAVTTGGKCRWTVVNTNDWVTLLSDPEIAGSGQVVYVTQPNPVFAERRGSLLIADQVYTVIQRPLSCSFSLSPTSRYHGYAATNGTIKVTATPDCAWTVLNTNAWITITGGASGAGTDTVSYALTENRVIGRRSGSLLIGDEIFVMNQWGTNCEVVLTPSASTFSELSATGLVSVTTASGCGWRVDNTNTWISITTAPAGTNSGSFGYSIASNPTLIPRTGVLSINGQPFQITQQSCSYQISPVSRAHSYLAQTGSVTVTAGAVCPWTVSNETPWITVLSGAAGTGSNTIKYSVAANPSGNARGATFTAAGQTFTVTQTGKPCYFTIDPEEFAHPETSDIGRVNVSAEPGCSWSVGNPASWVKLVSGQSGDGPGVVVYLAEANNGPARSTTLTIAGQDYVISQQSAVRSVKVGDTIVASGQTNCVPVTLEAHGGENTFACSLCFDTNFLVFRSAQLQPGAPAGTTLAANTTRASNGCIGLTATLPPGASLSPQSKLTVQSCFSALAVNGKAATSLSFGDTPVTRRVADALGGVLPADYTGGTVTVVGFCSLAESLDAPQLTWTTSAGAPAWRCQTNLTHDGENAAVSGPTPDGGESLLETTLTGPGALSFWWKVSSEPVNDRLRLYMDGTEQFRISGEVDWEWRTFDVPAGIHVLRWRYSKSSSVAGGSDRGWVDQVVYQPAPPVIVSQPVPQRIETGSAATFNVAAEGQPPFTYQWLLNSIALADGASVRGSGTATLTLSNVQPAQAGVYSVVVGNAQGSSVSTGAVLDVTAGVPLGDAVDAPALTWAVTGSPAWIGQTDVTHDGLDAAQSGRIGGSQTTSFQTSLTGPGTVRFWWKVSSETNNDRLLFYLNGSEQARISGEVDWRQASFVAGPGVQNFQWSYSKNSSTNAGQDRGWVDQIEFLPAPPVISTPPLDQVVDQGATVVFGVIASGAAPLSYQWQLNGTNLVESALLRGTTNASLTLSNVSPAQAGDYSVVVANSAGVVSASAALQVVALVPLAEALDAPGLTWTTNGTPPWMGQKAVSHDGADAARSGRISDSQTTSFQTTVTGPGTISFWWKVSSESNDKLRFYLAGSQQENIVGEVDWTWRSFSIPSGTQALEWRYTKNSSAAGGQDCGWVDQIQFIPANGSVAPVFAIQPESRTTVAPTGAIFNAVAIGSAPLAYQWLFNGVALSNGSGISGATTTNLVISNTTLERGGAYSVVATNRFGRATSEVASLSVITSPVIVTPPVSQTVAAGTTVNMSVAALGSAPLAFQWRLNGTNLFNNANFSGVTSANLRLTNVVAARAGAYTAVLSNSAGSITSAVAMLVVDTSPAITTQPASQSIIMESNVTLSVGASGGNLTYQWKFNGGSLADGQGISGSATPALTINNVQPANAGAYSVTISNVAGMASSASALLTVLVPPAITALPVDQTIPENGTARFTAAANGTVPLAYRWRWGGTNLADGGGFNGATTATLVLTNAAPGQSGWYSVEVSNAVGVAVSAAAQLTVIPAMTLGEAVNAPYLQWTTGPGKPWLVVSNVTHDDEAAAQSGAIGHGSNSWMEMNVVGPGSVRFWWKVSSQTNADELEFLVNNSTWAQISGEVDWQKLSFVVPAGTNTLRWAYSKDNSISNGVDRGWLDEVDYAPAAGPAVPALVTQPESLDLDPGATATFAVEAVGTAPLNYQWRFEGNNLSDSATVLGANSPTLRLFNVQPGQSGLYDVVVRNTFGLDISEQVFLSVAPQISIPVALDTDRTNMVWFLGGYSQWRGQTNITADRVDAAQSGPVANNATNWIQTSVAGPGIIQFWWKVSSETNRDFLRFSIDNVEVANISGEVDWQKRGFPITAAASTVRWAYTKSPNGSAGIDRAWLDLVENGPSAPVITNWGRVTNIVEQGTTVKINIDPAGTPPFSYQWRLNGTNLADGPHLIGASGVTGGRRLILTNAQPEQSGLYSCQVWNEAGLDLSGYMSVTVTPVLPIAPAVNTPTWVWETGGWSWWVGENSGSHDGQQCARSGVLPDNASTWMRTTVTGPGTLSFWWRASTQTNMDFLNFYVNGALQGRISGEQKWQQKTYSLSDGSFLLQWEYAKDGLLTNGLDQVFVDQVAFAPLPPTFTNQPLAQTVDAGAGVTLTAGVKGAQPMTYIWRLNGVPLTDSANVTGTATPVLCLIGAQPSQSGTYTLLVTSSVGSATSSNAVVTVVPVLPLADSLGATNLIWVTGSPPWIGQPVVTHDGVSAARSPALGNSQSGAFQTTVAGPGTVSYWWKVSSETNQDYLSFSLGGIEQARISGEVNWQQRTFAVSAGNQTLTWTYAKNGSGTAGQDRGWVDQFIFTPLAPIIVGQPANQAVEQGAQATFTALATGTAPLTNQWRFNGLDISDGAGISGARTATLSISNAQAVRAGSYSLLVRNAQGAATSSNALLTVAPMVPLAAALDATNFTWTTNSGGSAWAGQSLVSHDGVDGARSGVVSNSGSGYIQTIVTGPGTISFWWKVSSEAGQDALIFATNSVEQARISGEIDWAFKTFAVGPGSQTLRWTYSKNATIAAGQDRGWVDQFVFGPVPAGIASAPSSQGVDAGGSTTFKVTPAGTPPFTYQWQFNGASLANGSGVSGATSSNLVLSSIQAARAGAYRVVVSNSLGSAISAEATLSVYSPLSLAVALDTTNVTWITNGTPPWIGHAAVTHDGVDAARSGAISDGGSTSMETTINGPQTVSFWWKVSCETNNDRLRFYVNGSEQSRITGEVNWTPCVFNVGSGSQTLTWTYSKNSSGSAGQDRGWVDQVVFGPAPPVITAPPVSTVADEGGPASFAVSATATPPMAYQWLFNGVPLDDSDGVSGATTSNLFIPAVQAWRVGSYSVTVSNSLGGVTSASATLSLSSAVSLALALDAPGLVFTTGGTGAGSTGWSGQRAVSHDGADAAQTPAGMADSTYTWIKTTVVGPGPLSFWWKVSSELDHDYLRFMVDAVDQVKISGEVNWQQITFDVPSGTHELQWRYSRSPGGVAGQDRAWLDQVSFGGNSGPVLERPYILIQPASQTANAGDTVNLSVAAGGSAPLSYQWLYASNTIVDGGNIGGATTPILTFFNVRPAEAGNYMVMVSNAAGAVASTVARLTVIPFIDLPEALDMPDALVMTDSDLPWSGQTAVTHDGSDAARTGVIVDGQSSSMQTLVNGPGTIRFWWKVSSETNVAVLVFSVNGHADAFLTGEMEWQEHSVTLPAGPQVIDWSYLKSGGGASSEASWADAGWVDQLSFAGLGVSAQRVEATAAMATQITMAGDMAQLTWNAQTPRTYKVFYKESLSDKEWKLLDGEVLASWKIADGSVASEVYTATVVDLLAGRSRFYRVFEY